MVFGPGDERARVSTSISRVSRYSRLPRGLFRPTPARLRPTIRGLARWRRGVSGHPAGRRLSPAGVVEMGGMVPATWTGVFISGREPAGVLGGWVAAGVEPGEPGVPVPVATTVLAAEGCASGLDQDFVAGVDKGVVGEAIQLEQVWQGDLIAGGDGPQGLPGLDDMDDGAIRVGGGDDDRVEGDCRSRRGGWSTAGPRGGSAGRTG